MDAIYTIPVIGVLIQFIGYLIEVLPAIAPIFLATSAPIALGALCGLMNERSGVVNIGIEGMMLTAAFVAALVTASLNASLGEPKLDLFGATPALLLGVVAGVIAAMVMSAIHAWLSISIRADHILALGLTGYLHQLISRTSPPNAGTFGQFAPPEALIDLPFVGWIIRMFFAQGPIAMSVLFIVIFLQVMLFRSRWGLRTRAVGEHPKAAETVGIDVIRVRYRNVILGGIFAGLAGAYLTLESAGSFQTGMTNGRGFIALAALIFGRWTPIGAFGAALLFTASAALERAIQFNTPSGQLGDVLTAIPPQVYSALPYLITIIILAGVVGRSIAPAAVGQPYERETRT
jgi:simple sugar transport system permease protein